MKPPPAPDRQSTLYEEATRSYGRELARFMRGYERDIARCEELQQELLLAIWQSLAAFRGDCSLRTWVYRVAHNVGATHVGHGVRQVDRNCVELEAAELIPDDRSGMERVEGGMDLERILALVHRLRPVDREVMLLYLEDVDAPAIGEITGLSAGNVATKIHRIKAVLAAQLGYRSDRHE